MGRWTKWKLWHFTRCKAGGILSTHLYKIFVQDLLLELESQCLGFQLGDIYIGTPTCTDDIALIESSKDNLQIMINVIGRYAKQHHYRIHPMKTKIIQYSTTNDEYRWYLDGKGDEQELLSFERRLLKQIQGLTDRCPTIAVYSLLGAIPITTQIEKNILTTFYSIAANKEFVEHEIARRRLAIKDQNSNSCFTHIRKLPQKYSLPTAYDLMERPPTKGKWKAMLNNAVAEHHMTE